VFCSGAFMSPKLQARAKAFLERPVPEGISYVPDSLSERFIAAYAEQGRLQLDADLSELLGICLIESFGAASGKTGGVAAYFRENAELLQAIKQECEK
jgi:hypothetical protein